MGVADSVQYTLRPKDIQKASELLNISQAMLEQMNALRLLNVVYIRHLLIRADYERLTSGLHWLEHQDKTYKFSEVIRALEKEYNINKKVLNQILNGRNETMAFCSKCGVRISSKLSSRTGGLCSNCFADTLEL